MPVETATYIADLVVANPLTTDGLAQGDDHLRLIKTVLKNTLPNLNTAVSATVSQLNNLNGIVPVGGIILWSGSSASIPTNWHLCDGTVGTPNLMDRFVVGAGSTYAFGATGGATSTTPTTSATPNHTHPGTSSDVQGDHAHSAVTGLHALTLAEIPNHSHMSGDTFLTTSFGGSALLTLNTGSTLNVGTVADTGQGGNQGHSHTIGIDGGHVHNITVALDGGHAHTVTVATLPPYYALCYIMRTT